MYCTERTLLTKVMDYIFVICLMHTIYICVCTVYESRLGKRVRVVVCENNLSSEI